MKKYLPVIGLAGLLLIAVGGVSYAIKGTMETYIIGMLWAGLLLLLFFFYVYFPEVRNSLTGRSAKYGANAAFMIVVFITILGLVLYMSARYKVRWDLTATKRYTLSDQSKKIVKSLKKDVTAISFYRSDERTRQAMEDLLQELSKSSSKFTYQFIDPDKEPGKASKYGVTSYRTTLIMSGDNRQTVGYESEERLINAILKVTKDEIKSVYFLTGHAENSISDMQNSGYKAIKESMEKENYKVKEIALPGNVAVPDDCSLLIVSGPKKDLLPDEASRISNFIIGGGSVLFMLDPGNFPEVEKFLGAHGFKIGNNVVIDKMSQVFGANYLVPVVNQYEENHPITQGFDIMTFFPLARTVDVEKNPEKGIYPLALTGDGSWGETDVVSLEEGAAKYDEFSEKKGPLSVAAVAVIDVNKESKEDPDSDRKMLAKMVVFGDSDFVNNTHVNLAGNKDLFLNTVGWLTEEAELISVRKKESYLTPVILTATQARLIFWIPVVVIPSFVLVIGIAVLTRRRIDT